MPFPSTLEIESGLSAFNAFLAQVWSYKQDEFPLVAAREAEELAKSRKEIDRIWDLELGLGAPPVLRFEPLPAAPGRFRAVLRAPGADGWDLSFRATVRKELFAGIRFKANVKVRILGLRIEAFVDVDRPSELAASFVDSGVEADLEKLDVESSNLLFKMLGKGANLLRPVVTEVAAEILEDKLGDALPCAEGVRAVEALHLAVEPPACPGWPVKLEEHQAAADGIEERILEQLRSSILLSGQVPKGQPGAAPAHFRHFEDSAIWTGHWVAAEALRYGVTRDPQAVDRLRRGLEGLESLVHLTDRPGLLSRAVADKGSDEDLDLLQELEDKRQQDRLFTSLDGLRDGVGHVTRDQYAGAFLGAGLAALLVDEEEHEVRGLAERIVIEMADYLVGERFCPTEAKPDPVTGTRMTSVTYLSQPAQVLAILRIASRLRADRFEAAYRDFFPVASILWFFDWLQTLDPHGSYYKFNLSHSTWLLLLTAESDPERRARLAPSLAMLRLALRYHANAYFDCIELETLQDDTQWLSRPREELEKEVRHLLACWRDRPPLIEPFDPADHPEIRTVDYPGVTRSSLGHEPEKIASSCVEVPTRPGTDFLWQRSPFCVDEPWIPDDYDLRPPGVDFLLPYWMGRRLGL